MKKRLFILMMAMILLMPGMVSAKSYQADLFNNGGSGDDYYNDVDATTDGGYIAVGNTHAVNFEGLTRIGGYDVLLVKYDKNDKIEWQKLYGGSSDESFYRVKATSDGGYVAVGVMESTDFDGLVNNGYADGIIIKFDELGNIEWQQSYGGDDYDYYHDVIETKDGGYVAVASVLSASFNGLTNNGGYDAVLVKYDKNGNIVWQQNYGGEYSEWVNDVLEDSDGNFVAVGGTNESGSDDGLIFMTDENGELLGGKLYGGSYFDGFNAVVESDDGGYVVVGNTESYDIPGLTLNGYWDSILVKYDKNGNLLWQKSYNVSEYGSLYLVDIEKDTDGNFITIGSGRRYCYERVEDVPLKVIEPIDPLTCGGWSSMTIGKYDNEGNSLWQEYYGGNDVEELYGITITENGEYVAVGYTFSTDIEGITNNGYEDAVVLKIKTIYDITEEKSTNGEFTTVQVGKRGRIEVKPSAGYVVDKITVTDSLNNEVTSVKEGDYYYFDLYDDVKVRITFKEATILDLINPETGSGQIIEFVVIIGLVVGGLVYFNRKKVFGK